MATPKPTGTHLEAAAVRGVRAAIVAGLGFILVKWYGHTHTITGLINDASDNWDEAGGTAVLAGLGAFGWRWKLDPSKIPSLKDVDQPAPDGE